MDKDYDKVIKFLQKAGIWPKDGKIAKADVPKVRKALAQYKAQALPKLEKWVANLRLSEMNYQSLRASCQN
jgi:hypothetical protein